MPIHASDFGGRYGLLIGCGLIILIAGLGFAWMWLQLVSLFSSNRLPLLLLVPIVAFSFVPGYIVMASLREMQLHTLSGFPQLLFIASLCGLILLPLTITREAFKFIRDRRPSPRRRRPQTLSKRPRSEKPDDEE